MPALTKPIVTDGRMRALDQPVLRAGAFTVRPWHPDDAPAVFAAYQDPGIQQWHVRSMDSVDEAAGWIRSWPARWQAETGADWAVVESATLVGRVGINRLDLWDGIAVLAYWVVPAARGRGVAAAAVEAVTAWAIDVLGVHRVQLSHASDNPASCRVATKAGFLLEGTLRSQGHHADGWHDMHLHAHVAGHDQWSRGDGVDEVEGTMTTATEKDGRTALVVGASRGIGLGLAQQLLERGWWVIATVRSAARTPLHDLLEQHGDRLTVETVDITEPEQVSALHERVSVGRAMDLVLVNAGTSHERWETVADVATETFVQVMVTNALAPMRFVEQFQDLVAATGTIAVMSSGQGSITNNTRVTGWEVYRASKAALNQLMRSFAARHPDDPRTLLLTAPGWVQTDMGGADAPLTVEASTRGVIDTIEANAGHGGLQYLDHKGASVAW